MRNLDDIEEWVDESIRRAVAAGYHPTAFQQMRERWGTKKAMERLVISGDIQSGFVRLRDLGLLDWSVEAGVLRFPSIFDKTFREAAQFRIDQAKLA